MGPHWQFLSSSRPTSSIWLCFPILCVPKVCSLQQVHPPQAGGGGVFSLLVPAGSLVQSAWPISMS